MGKSSLINSIMKRTVVSASKTPGHTKHFQTIHIADNVRLCDSPGLVFPAMIPRSLQVKSSAIQSKSCAYHDGSRYSQECIQLLKYKNLTVLFDIL